MLGECWLETEKGLGLGATSAGGEVGPGLLLGPGFWISGLLRDHMRPQEELPGIWASCQWGH